MKKVLLNVYKEKETDEECKYVVDSILDDLEELRIRRNKDRAIPIRFSSHGQTCYLFSKCPLCDTYIQYTESEKEAYCRGCGQLLQFSVFKDVEFPLKKYKFDYLVRDLSFIHEKIVEAISLREAVLRFHKDNPNRFDILKVELIK